MQKRRSPFRSGPPGPWPDFEKKQGPKKRSSFPLLAWFLLIVGAIIMLVPFLWMVLTSVKPANEIVSYPPVFIPSKIIWTRFDRIFKELNFGLYFLNSIYISTLTTVIALFTSALTGYIFAKYEFTGKNLLFTAILATMMIPFTVTMIPMYLLFSKMGLVDHHLSIILPSLYNTFGIFMMRQFMQGLPTELMESGRIDGASEFRIFFRIMLPQTKPALAALGIFIFMWQWDNFLWPLIVLQSDSGFTLPVGLAAFSQQYWTDYGLVMAVATVTVIPVLLVFLCLQKHFIKGITMTGIKG